MWRQPCPTISSSSEPARAAMSAPSARRSSASRRPSSRSARPMAAPASTSAAFPRRRCCTPPQLFDEAKSHFRGTGHRGRRAQARPHEDDDLQAGGRRRQRQGRRVPAQEEQDRRLLRHGPHRRRRPGRGAAEDGSTQVLETQNIVIATGSDVTRLPGVEIDEKVVVSSTGALELESVPKRLVVIGAGVIGLELGSVWRRLGSEVIVVEYPRPHPARHGRGGRQAVPAHPQQAGLRLQAVLEGHQGRAFEKRRGPDGRACGGRRCRDDRGGRGARRHRARVPTPRGSGSRTIGVQRDDKGRILTDAHFATNVTGIYAIGDVIAGPMLAHKAEDEGVAVAEILAGKAGHVNYDVIPNVVYTFPEVASVGKTEEELKAGGHRLQRRQVPLHRERPRQGEPHHRRLREDPGRRARPTACSASTSSGPMPAT